MCILTDLVTANVLWLICSLPIVTMGASNAALYTVTLRAARGKEGEAASLFWRAFREDLRQGTVLTLGALAVAALLIVDYNLYDLESVPGFAFIGMTAVALLVLVLLTWAFPYMAKFGDTTLNLCRNCLKLAVLNPGKTVLLVLMNLAVWGLTLLFLMARIRWFFFWTLCAASGAAYVNSFLIDRAFAPILRAAQASGKDEDPAERTHSV